MEMLELCDFTQKIPIILSVHIHESRMMTILISGITCIDTNKIMLILPLHTNVFWLKRLQLATHFDPFTNIHSK